MDKVELTSDKVKLLLLFFLWQSLFSTAQVNLKATCKTRDSVIIDAPINKVWQVLTTFEKWPQNFDFIKSAALKDSFAVNRKFNWETTKLKLTSTLLKINPQSQLLWKGSKYGVLVYHDWIFVNLGRNKTLLISHESQQGLIPFLFRKKFSESLKKGSIKWLNQIKQASEK